MSALHHLVVHIYWTCCSLLWDYGKLPKFFSDCCCTEADRVASISSLGQRCILKVNKHCKLAPVNRCSLCAELTECRLFLVHPAKAALVLDMVTAPATLSPFAAGSCAPWLAP